MSASRPRGWSALVGRSAPRAAERNRSAAHLRLPADRSPALCLCGRNLCATYFCDSAAPTTRAEPREHALASLEWARQPALG